MSILAAFMVPHPPMIVPEIGQGSEAQVAETTRAYEQAADEIAALSPETIAGLERPMISAEEYLRNVNGI